jgi:hypothetical protein
MTALGGEQGDQIGRIFSPFGRLFSMGSFVKITEVALFLGPLLHRKKVCIKYVRKRVGLHFGPFFHKLIWSPWRRGAAVSSKRSESLSLSPAGARADWVVVLQECSYLAEKK